MDTSIIFKKLVRFPKLVILFTLLFTLFFAYEAKKELFSPEGSLIVDTSIEPVMARESGSYDFYLKMNDTFAKKDVMILAIKPKEFDLDFINKLQNLQNDLKENLRGVEGVLSILNAPNPNGVCSGESYFHVERAGSICSSIIEEVNNKIACINGKMPVVQTSNDDLDGGLDDDLDAGLDEGLDSDLEVGLDDNLDEGLQEDLSVGLDDDLDTGLDDNILGESEAQTILEQSFICTDIIASNSLDEVIKNINKDISKTMSFIQNDKFMKKDIISEDASVTAFVIEFKSGIKAMQSDIQNDIKNIINKYQNENLRIAYAGEPRQQYSASKILINDVSTILPISIFLMSLILFFSFRSIRGIFIPIITVSMGIIWTFGWFAILGESINLVSVIIPTLLLAVGSAYIIHVLNFYYSNSKTSTSKIQIIDHTIEHISLPMLVTAFTTLSGFAALMLSPIPAVAQMGFFSCIGIGSVIFMALTFVPALLLLLPLKEYKNEESKTTILDTLLLQKSFLVDRFSKKFIKIWIFIVLLALIGASQVRFDSVSSSFNKDLDISKDQKFIEQSLAGIRNIKVVLSGDDLQSAKTILGLDKINKFLLNPKGSVSQIENLRIDKIYSVVDYIDQHRQGLDNLKDKEVVIFFEDLKKNNGPKFLSDDKKYIQFDIRMTASGSSASIVLRDQLKVQLERYLPHLDHQFTGSEILTSESIDNIAKSQIQSLAMALVIIFIILSALFFSFKMGFLAIYPNIAAIAIFFGILGYFDIPIGVTVSVIAAIALGIGVDDTIHFLTHYNSLVKSTRDERKSSLQTLRLIGKPMVYTTLTLALGFIVFGMSDMTSQVLFGVLTVLTLIVCLVTDLNFLPSIMAETKLITVWDYLDIKYDEKFIREIPIFDDLDLKETKLATLLAYSVDLKDGEHIFKQDDDGNEMYLILSGAIDIYLTKKDGSSITLVELAKGEEFGEMGLFRKSKRSASAKAIGDTKLLVLNDKVLKNIQKRYPRIAAKLFRNLALNLSNSIKKGNDLIKKSHIDVKDKTYYDFNSNYSSILENLRDSDRAWIRNNAEIREVKEGEYLYKVGELGASMAFIYDGKFDVSISEGKSLFTLSRNDVVGEMTLLSKDEEHKRTANVKALADSTVLIVSKELYEDAIKSRWRAKFMASLNYNFVCLLSDRLQNSNNIIYN